MSHEDAQPDLDTGSDEQQNGASRKGQPWTEEEHLAFLEGLRKLGKGSWRAISSTFVPSRTPTQVASHAQKHFMRLHGATKRKSRFTALEQEAPAGGKGDTRGDHDHHRVDDDARPDQPTAQPGGQAQQPAQAFPPMGAFPGAMSFPFMHPMMFGFPGGFFPPFMCPPPAFAAAPMGAMPKGGQMPPVMMPPMFPMAAMAMAPYFAMAQQMAVAAAAQAAAVAQQNQQQQGQYAAVSAGATTAGTTSDTANSDEVAPRVRSTPGSPGGPCKPDARRPSVTGGAALARPGEASSSPSVPPASCQGGSGGKRAAPAGNAGVAAEESPAKLPRRSSTGHGGDEATVPFHASSHSAFRPPQEIKAES